LCKKRTQIRELRENRAGAKRVHMKRKRVGTIKKREELMHGKRLVQESSCAHAQKCRRLPHTQEKKEKKKNRCFGIN
jgi:hypothetical protein